MKNVKSEIKLKLRKGIERLETEIWGIRDQYLRGDISLQEYLDRRSALEIKKVSKILENLRKLHHSSASRRENDIT